MEHLREVLLVLCREQLFAAPKKYSFMTESVLFLGYVVSKNGLSVDKSKIEAIRDWPQPTNLFEVQSFHSLDPSIGGSSLILVPLQHHLQIAKAGRFTWTKEAQHAFTVMK